MCKHHQLARLSWQFCCRRCRRLFGCAAATERSDQISAHILKQDHWLNRQADQTPQFEQLLLAMLKANVMYSIYRAYSVKTAADHYSFFVGMGLLPKAQSSRVVAAICAC